MNSKELDLGDYYFLYPFIVLVLTAIVFITLLSFVEIGPERKLKMTLFSFIIFSILLFPTTLRMVLNKSNYKGIKKYVMITIRFLIWLLLASFIALIVFVVLFYIIAVLFTGGYKIGLPHLPF